MCSEQHRFWVLIGAIIAVPLWVLFGIILLFKWLSRVVNDLIRKWIFDWPDYQ